MKWDKQTIRTVVIVFLTVAFTSFVIKFAMDHDGESYTVSLGGDDESSSSAPLVTEDPQDPQDSQDSQDEIETGDIDDVSGLPWIREDDLPVFAQGTLAIIDQGGPFPFDRDGITFENREGILPDESRGYYREYTVLEPGSVDRGPLRIVTGDGGEYYWTEDHYASFERILRRSR